MAGGKKGSGLENISLLGKLAIAIVFMGLVGAVYAVVFYGEVDDAIEAQVQLKAQKENELDGMKDADRAYNKDLTELERRKQTAVKQKKILPDGAEWAPFLDTMQRSATISGVTLTTWEPKAENNKEFFVAVPMEVHVSGRFHQVAKFFATVGQNDRIINMANISMVRKKQKKSSGPSINEGEESITVQVKATATAFRALAKPKVKKKRGSRGRKGSKK